MAKTIELLLGGHRILDHNGNPMPLRKKIKFINGSCTDDAGNDKTIVEYIAILVDRHIFYKAYSIDGASFVDFDPVLSLEYGEEGLDGVMFAASVNEKLYKSTDNGETWVDTLEKGKWTVATDGAGNWVAGHPDPVDIYHYRMYSNDNGVTWNKVGDHFLAERFVYAGGGSFIAVQAGVGINIRRSINGGVTFSDVGSGHTGDSSYYGLPGTDRNGTVMVAWKDGKISISTNSGASFSGITVPGLTGEDCHSKVVTDGNGKWAVAWETKIAYSLDDGNTWNTSDFGITGSLAFQHLGYMGATNTFYAQRRDEPFYAIDLDTQTKGGVISGITQYFDTFFGGFDI